MKRIVQTVCVILVLSMMLAIPAHAETTAEPRGSAFFGSYAAYLYKTSSTSFQIWFDVDANAAIMDELGVSEIALYRSTDQQTWSKIKIYYKNAYSVMVEENSFSYVNYVTYNFASPGYYYYARVTFYAKNSTGVGMRDYYTDILAM